MISTPPRPHLRPIGHGDFLLRPARYELVEDYASDFHGVPLLIPRLFSYDGASIPRAAWGITTTPYDPRVMPAALVHDWLYLTHQTSRQEADELFLAYLIAEPNLSRHRAILMFTAVSRLGGLFWKLTPAKLAEMRCLRDRLIRADVDVTKYRWPVGI